MARCGRCGDANVDYEGYCWSCEYQSPDGAGQPAAGQPFAGQPGAGQPFAGQPGAGQPFAGPPAPGQSSGYLPGRAAGHFSPGTSPAGYSEAVGVPPVRKPGSRGTVLLVVVAVPVIVILVATVVVLGIKTVSPGPVGTLPAAAAEPIVNQSPGGASSSTKPTSTKRPASPKTGQSSAASSSGSVRGGAGCLVGRWKATRIEETMSVKGASATKFTGSGGLWTYTDEGTSVLDFSGAGGMTGTMVIGGQRATLVMAGTWRFAYRPVGDKVRVSNSSVHGTAKIKIDGKVVGSAPFSPIKGDYFWYSCSGKKLVVTFGDGSWKLSRVA